MDLVGRGVVSDRVMVFSECLALSKGSLSESDAETIARALPGCVGVKAVEDPLLDKRGVDYIATLRGGAEVFVDAKYRDTVMSDGRRASQSMWRSGPELTLEIWSVTPWNFLSDHQRAWQRSQIEPSCGWTLSESKVTDLVLFTWHPGDTDQAVIVPFQHLRAAFRRHHEEWRRRYKLNVQRNQSARGRRYHSTCVFVPAPEVFRAIASVSVVRRGA